jgi:hypothetical protein
MFKAHLFIELGFFKENARLKFYILKISKNTFKPTLSKICYTYEY